MFPQWVPVTVFDGKPADLYGAIPGKRLPAESLHEELDAVSTKAEASLYSEAVVIEEQARRAQPLKSGCDQWAYAAPKCARNLCQRRLRTRRRELPAALESALAGGYASGAERMIETRRRWLEIRKDSLPIPS